MWSPATSVKMVVRRLKLRTYKLDSNMARIKSGFTLISKDAYVDRFLTANPSERRRDVVSRLEDAITAYKAGKRCNCGKPIWIVGSAAAGYGCFTCITGEAKPDNDYEIDD